MPTRPKIPTSQHSKWTTPHPFLIGVEVGKAGLPVIRANLARTAAEIVGAQSGNGNTAFYVAFAHQELAMMQQIAEISPPDLFDITRSIELFMKNPQAYPQPFVDFLCDQIIQNTGHNLLEDSLTFDNKSINEFFRDYVSKRNEGVFVKDICAQIILNHMDLDDRTDLVDEASSVGSSPVGMDDYIIVNRMFKYALIDPNMIAPESGGHRFVETLVMDGCPKMATSFLAHGATVNVEMVENLISILFAGSDLKAGVENDEPSLKCLVTALMRLDANNIQKVIDKRDSWDNEKNLLLTLETVKEYRSSERQDPETKRVKMSHGANDGQGEVDAKSMLKHQIIGFCNVAARTLSHSPTQVSHSSQLAPAAAASHNIAS